MKICSYSYINKIYKVTWNECLSKAELNINRTLSLPIKQGRKLKVKNTYQVECLSCENIFDSFDPKFNRICNNCKHGIEYTGEDL